MGLNDQKHGAKYTEMKKMKEKSSKRRMKSEDSAVKEIVPLTSLFDPSSDSDTLRGCLDHYSRRISTIRVLIGNKERYKIGSTRETILLANHYGIPTSAEPEPSRTVIIRGILPIYLDLCAETGVKGILFRKDTLQSDVSAREVVALADARDLNIQYEIEDLSFFNQPTSSQAAMRLIDNAMEWLDSGAVNLVAGVTRQVAYNAAHINNSVANITYADLLATAFGLHTVMFKAPTENEQQALLTYFGGETHICDVPFTEVARVEKLRETISSTNEFSDTSYGKPIREEDRWPTRLIRRN
jgi:(2R)-phospho-3-sulfolactate synthase (ComA)